MKAVILAAGRGTRMGNLTKDCPKPLIPIKGLLGSHPFLTYVLDTLIMNNIHDICIVKGYMGEKIDQFVEDYDVRRRFNNVTLVEQKEQLGTGHAVSLCEEFVGKDEFILMNGDSLFSINDINQLISFPGSVVAGKPVEYPEKYGVLVYHPERKEILHRIVEKPESPTSTLVNVGLYKLNPNIFNHLRLVQCSIRDELELPDAINFQTKTEPVYIYHLENYWLDLGCPEDISKIEEYLNDRI